MDADRLVDSISDLVTDLHVLRGKPATDTFVLKVCIQPFGKVLVLAGVADEAGVILEGLTGQGGHVLDEVFWDTTSTEEGFWYFTSRCNRLYRFQLLMDPQS